MATNKNNVLGKKHKWKHLRNFLEPLWIEIHNKYFTRNRNEVSIEDFLESSGNDVSFYPNEAAINSTNEQYNQGDLVVIGSTVANATNIYANIDGENGEIDKYLSISGSTAGNVLDWFSGITINLTSSKTTRTWYQGKLYNALALGASTNSPTGLNTDNAFWSYVGDRSTLRSLNGNTVVFKTDTGFPEIVTINTSSTLNPNKVLLRSSTNELKEISYNDFISELQIAVGVTNPLRDSLLVPSVNFWNRQLIRSSGTQVFNWENNRIYDSSGGTSAYFNFRYLEDSNGALSVLWGSRTLADLLSQTSIAWDERTLYNNSGIVTFNYQNGILFNPTDSLSVLNLGTRTISSISGQSLNFSDGFRFNSKWAFNNFTPTLTSTGYSNFGGTSSPVKTGLTNTSTLNDVINHLRAINEDLKTKGIISI